MGGAPLLAAYGRVAMLYPDVACAAGLLEDEDELPLATGDLFLAGDVLELRESLLISDVSPPFFHSLKSPKA